MQISVYKLDKDKVDVARYMRRTHQARTTEGAILSEPSTQIYVEAIVDRHNSEAEEGKSSARKYIPVTEGQIQQVANATFYTYHSENTNREHYWNRFFPTSLGLESPVYENVASFYAIDGEIFVISSGHGIGLFEQYIDDAFPIEVAQRIMHPDPTSANERIVAGNVFGRTQSFRQRQVMSAAKSINSVWQSVGGKLTNEAILSEEFLGFFPRHTKEVNADFSGAVLIKKSLSLAQLPLYTKWLLNKSEQELTPAQKKSFSYLRGLTKVSERRDKALIKRLNVAYTKYILDVTRAGYDYNIDFAHSKYNDFVLARAFDLRANGESEILQYEDVYAGNPAKYVVNRLHHIIDDAIEEAHLDDEGVYMFIKDDVRIMTDSGDVTHDILGPFLSFFQGEFDFEDRKFFRIDGRWYEASIDFVSLVKKEFVELIGSSFMADPADYGMPLNPVGNTEENVYNRLYAVNDGYIVADKVEVDGIEIADVLRITDDGVEIHHNKIGFGASIRDVRSQLSLSMALMDRILGAKEEGRRILGDYYDTLARKYTAGEYSALSLGLSKDDFVERIINTSPQKFTFILGCLDHLPIVVSRKSTIAKYELIGLCKVDAREYNFRLKVIRIGHAA